MPVSSKQGAGNRPRPPPCGDGWGGPLTAHFMPLRLEVVTRGDDVYEDRRDTHRRQDSNQERPESQ